MSSKEIYVSTEADGRSPARHPCLVPTEYRPIK